MSNLAYYENIIKEKRKKTKFRDFLKDVGSWWPLVLSKIDQKVSRYPDTDRKGKSLYFKEFPASWLDIESNNGLINKINFFEDFKSLFINSQKPLTNQFYGQNENADFSDIIFGVKNCYLSFAVGGGCENVLYSAVVYTNCHNIYNSSSIGKSSNIYYSNNINESQNIFYSKTIFNSYNIWFSSNLIGCNDCIFCNDLENKKYCINNIEYTKDDYLRIKNEILKNKNDFNKYFEKNKILSKNFNSKNVFNSIGVMNSENIKNGMFVNRVKDGKNLICVDGVDSANSFYDCIESGINSNNFYGVGGSGSDSSNIFLSIQIGKSSNIYYSYMIENCSFCLGCIGLKNKSFCILNKQYSKEEWYEIAEKIFSQMEKDGTLGEFFPGSLNPFYFNDTMAYLIDDTFTKEEVEKEGYMWRDEEIKIDIPEGAEVVYTNSLSQTPPAHSSLLSQVRGIEGEFLSDYQGFDSNGNWFINPEIMKKVIKDSSGNIYKIVPMEYDFLMKHGLPLPEIHWLDRIKMGFRF